MQVCMSVTGDGGLGGHYLHVVEEELNTYLRRGQEAVRRIPIRVGQGKIERIGVVQDPSLLRGNLLVVILGGEERRPVRVLTKV